MLRILAGWRAGTRTLPLAHLLTWPGKPRRDPPAVFRWALASAGLTPVVLTGAWLVADQLQPASYSPVRQTVSALTGQGGTGRWVVTAALLLAAACYLVTAAGMLAIRWPGRALLVVAGSCSAGIALSPEPASGPTTAHLAWTVIGAVTITVWPAVASWQAPVRPEVMSARSTAIVTIAFAALLAWVVIEARGGPELGLAERVASSVQTTWPFVIAIALRWQARRLPGRAAPLRVGAGEAQERKSVPPP